MPEQFRKEIGGPIKEVIGYLFFLNDFDKIQADFGEIVGWRRKPLDLVPFEMRMRERGAKSDRE